MGQDSDSPQGTDGAQAIMAAVARGDFDSRGADRIQRVLFATVQGRHSTFRAMLLNISRTGALLTILDDAWSAEANDDEAHLAGLKVSSHFGEGMQVAFGGVEGEVEAEVVRVALGHIGRRQVWLLGCRFVRDLPHAMAAHAGLADRRGNGAAAGAQVAYAEAGRYGEEVELPLGDGPGSQLKDETVPIVVRAPHMLRTQYRGVSAQVKLRQNDPPVSMMDLLGVVVDRGATDLHLKAKSPVRLRIDSKLVEISDRPLEPKDAWAFAAEILDPDQMRRFEEDCDLDLAYSLEDRARFRINVLRARGEIGLAIRRIPAVVPSADELGIASVCLTMAERPRGLVLVTGPTGSGKSTTLAAMLHHVNTTRPCHIVTMEDPIEYIHSERLAHITQREVGRDTKDFAAALKRALRQDPDVILVGEMRDLETIAMAVTAAETGHLVFATLHTTSAPQTVDRIVDVFPPTQQRQVRMQLSEALQAIFSQVLVPRVGGGVVVAQEILVASGGVRALIREGKTPQIGNMMQTGGKHGMQTLEDALNNLVEQKKITVETALSKANNPEFINTPEKAAKEAVQRARRQGPRSGPPRR